MRTRGNFLYSKRGKPFFLRLDVDSEPPAVFQWFKNGYQLTEQVSQALFFASMEEDDAGTYSCLVSNLAGEELFLETTLHVSE